MRMTWQSRDPYALLEVPRDATDEEIKKAFRIQSMVWHPDRFADMPDLDGLARERCSALTDALGCLQDPEQRRRLDLSLGPDHIDRRTFELPEQNDPAVWKAMAAWMKDEDVGTGFLRSLAFSAGDVLEKGREPSEKQRPHMLEAWRTATAAGFEPYEEP